MKIENRDRFYQNLNQPKKPRFTAMRIVMLVFGILGGVYTVIGGVLLSFLLHARKTDMNIVSLGEDADTALPILAGVFGVLGVAFLLAAVILWLMERRRRRRREELLTWGQRATGKVVQVRQDYTVRVNRVNPWIAQVECPFPRGTVTLKSPRLWQTKPQVGDAVTILYDPMDEKQYVMLFPGEA